MLLSHNFGRPAITMTVNTRTNARWVRWTVTALFVAPPASSRKVISGDVRLAIDGHAAGTLMFEPGSPR